eukprot:6174736-Pleurochrysis_carterae.AAC.2
MSGVEGGSNRPGTIGSSSASIFRPGSVASAWSVVRLPHVRRAQRRGPLRYAKTSWMERYTSLRLCIVALLRFFRN